MRVPPSSAALAPLALSLLLGLTGCPSQRTQDSQAAGPSGGSAAPTPTPAPAPTMTLTPEESCVDAALQRQHLDSFGNPGGTMYPGGSPLFDERTGVSTPRLQYIYEHAPSIRDACAQKH